MTEATQLQPVRQAAAMHMNRLLQAAAVTFQVGLLDRPLPDPDLLPLLVPVGHPLLH